ncbi:putative expressed protein [Lyophyllum shimeji]|uniref:Expressed protein n=1 Tax=Lyophyllum shimeji TaxID=47721 RepID=A0A9P3PL32_LYOSH|nr:putative expressed protein [Lyophyllum shimeji]
MGEYAPFLGGLLLGSLLNKYFYEVVFVQNVAYYSMKFNDSAWVKSVILPAYTDARGSRAFVASLLCLDGVHTASLMYAIWVYAVQNYNNPLALGTLVRPLRLDVTIITIVAFMVQTFLA